VSQRNHGGDWVSLGSYTFNSGSGGNVVLTHTPAGTNDTACADAVRFIQNIPHQVIEIRNAHYYRWYDANGNGAIDPGEVYLVNVDGGSLTYYRFTDSNGDSIIDAGELMAEPNPPAAVITGRTYAEERQNFANWYSFYRRRGHTAIAAISKSIVSMQGVQVGINSINHRVRQPVLKVKVGGVDQTNTLLNSLYNMVIQADGTPTRQALIEVGQYFDADDGQSGGLGNSPYATAAEGGECQQAFAIVVTDGYYTNPSPSFGNTDGDCNTAFDCGMYGDSVHSSLGDIAMDYYERDLVASLDDLLPMTAEDQAPHQHMVTYGVAFGVVGTMNPADYDFVTTFPTWPNFETGDHERIDDLWHGAVNGRGLFLSAKNPEELVNSLLAVMANIGSRIGSSAAVSVNGDELYQTLGADIHMFQATYSSDGWTGDVKAFAVDLLTGQVLTGSPLWSASEELDNKSWNSRLIATFDGVEGRPFRYANLTAEMQGLLDSDPTTAGRILDYVRGDPTWEQASGNGGTFRNRVHKLGDVVHSSPVYENGMLYAGGNDGMLHAFNADTGVEQFAYVPKHVFDHLRDLAAPTYSHKFYVDLTPSVEQISLSSDGEDNDDDGQIDEPDEAMTILVGGLGKGGRGFFALDVTNASTITNEAILKNRVMWEYPNRRIVSIDNVTPAGGLIQITTATPHGFSTGNTVKVRSVGGTTEANGDWTVTGITDTSFSLDGSTYAHPYTSGGTVESTNANWDDIGFSFSKPAIVNSKAGWIVVFGNGYNSSTGIAKLFVLDALTGSPIKVIDTGVGSCDGLSSPTPTDVDFDGKVDYVYAGDLKGNMWKFDLTSDDVNNWGVAYKSGITPKPLFQAMSPEGLPQPITAKPDVMVSCTSDRDGYMVLFGTGRYLGEFDMYADYTNSLYGVWDYGEDVDDSEYLGVFQRGSTPELLNQPDSVTLLEQTTVLSTEADPNFFTVTLGPGQTLKVRVLTNHEIDWTTTSLTGSGTCAVDGLGIVPCDPNGTGVKADPAAHAGWYYDLPLNGERVVSDVLLRQGRAIFVPYTPTETPCGSGGESVLMELEACSGSRPRNPVMDINGDGVIDEHDVIEIAPGVFVAAAGIQFPGRLQPPAILIMDNDKEKKYSASSKGTIVTITEKAVTLGITHWMEIE
jgi:type IV pilus assembly protein PilY1